MTSPAIQNDQFTPTERAQLNEINHLQAENEQLERMLAEARQLNDELSALIVAVKANR